jgi:hypothetical protein
VRIGSGGRYAFVNAQLDPRAPTPGIQVDLRDGFWRKFGGQPPKTGSIGRERHTR